jgi:GDP-L-fucose synthase
LSFTAEKNKPLLICGSNGMFGSACQREFGNAGYTNILSPSRKELDYKNQEQVNDYFARQSPAYVILAAARVGGIRANIESPYEFLADNLAIQNNVIQAAVDNKVEKLVFLGSSCIYPKEAPQPMREECFMTGPLEPTNEGYAVAKIAGLRAVEYAAKEYKLPWISLMPPNLYGKNDHFDLNKSHVMSALVMKFVDANTANQPTVEVWGTGKAKREFMNVEDAAAAVRYFFEEYNEAAFLNIGVGEDVSIFELANMIKEIVGYKGEIIWDKTKPDGMMRKCLDVTRMKSLGFEPKITLAEGINQMVAEYKQHLLGGDPQ